MFVYRIATCRSVINNVDRLWCSILFSLTHGSGFSLVLYFHFKFPLKASSLDIKKEPTTVVHTKTRCESASGNKIIAMRLNKIPAIWQQHIASPGHWVLEFHITLSTFGITRGQLRVNISMLVLLHFLGFYYSHNFGCTISKVSTIMV